MRQIFKGCGKIAGITPKKYSFTQNIYHGVPENGVYKLSRHPVSLPEVESSGAMVYPGA
jgi:hypothetical protein